MLGRPDDVGEQKGSQNGCRYIGGSLAADEGFDGIDDLLAVPVGRRIGIAGDELKLRAGSWIGRGDSATASVDDCS